MSLELTFKDIKNNVSLKEYNSFKIDGTAKYFFVAQELNNLIEIINYLKEIKSDFYILGKGSNILITDGIIEKPVICLGEGFKKVEKKENNLISVGAAVELKDLLNYCIQNNFTGLENFAGIPASVGGMVLMNASSYGVAISDFIKEIEVVDFSGNCFTLCKQDVDFSYRESSLKEKVIVNVILQLEESQDVKKNIKNYLEKKYSSQDMESFNAGCIFKNPFDAKAAKLIENCGLKGYSIGKAAVSKKHSNYIVNLGGAKTKDIEELIILIKEKVFNQYGVNLEEEIVRWY